MISIIVPIYNVEKELSRCLYSLINQTYGNIEIILVNDGSTDGSLNICYEYQKSDKRITLINKENGGLSDARNYGIDAAKGEYILFVDSDDYLEHDACEKLLQGMQNDDIDFVVGALREVKSAYVSYQKHSNLESGKIYDSSEFIIKSIKNNEWYAPAVLNLYRKSFLSENNLRYKVGMYYEDMEMLPRLFLKAHKVSYIDYSFYNYIIREGSITSTTSAKKKTDVLQIYTDWKKYYDDVHDKELQKYLYGNLVRCYLKSCRTHKITGWYVSGVDRTFALKNSLNLKERIKALFFTLLPTVYVGINK